MNTPQHLAELWLLPASELQRYLAIAKKIADLREEIEGPPPAMDPPVQPNKSVEAHPNVVKPAFPQRSPMRPPKPDSLRGVVHAVLRRAGKPMRRADIIQEAAAERGVAVDEILKAKVGDLLTNRHDPFIQKQGHGVYAIALRNKEEVLCL